MNSIKGTIKDLLGWPGPCSGEAASKGKHSLPCGSKGQDLGAEHRRFGRSLDRPEAQSLNASIYGAVAQLGERSNRTAEVVGSIPFGSTKILNKTR